MALTRLDLRGADGFEGRIPRPEIAGDEPVDAVREILRRVREGGDAVLLELTEQFDGVRPDPLRVPGADLAAALDAVEPRVRDALTEARDAVQAFHEAQLPGPHSFERNGIRIEGEARAVARAGLYVPGGRAAYPSTVLMTAVPARVAGVDEVVLCVPPGPDGIATVTLAAAALAGVDEVYAVGGAQAIAALAYGTESIRPVDVIGGPGNVYVAIAKREVSGVVGVPAAFAGPSEVVVVADATTDVGDAAIDVVLQAEHGPDGLAWLICWDDAVADAVDGAVAEIVAASPRQAEIEATLASGGYAAVVDGPEAAAELANEIAPEHLELLCDRPADLVPLVRNAGAVFCGPLSPASIGDYVAGPSHVLPTNGSARFAEALTVSDFLKQMHVVTVEPAGFAPAADVVEVLAEAEGLPAHAESVRRRRR